MAQAGWQRVPFPLAPGHVAAGAAELPEIVMTRLALCLPLVLLAVACGDKDDDGTPYVPSGDDTGTDDTECDTGVDRDCDGVADEDDCDPDDEWVYPGATEIPYDGKDNDCAGDGDLTDVDGDGYDGVNGGGDDCNDSNPTIYPGAYDECYDGIDQDCDGFPAEPDEDTTDCDGDGHIGIGTEATDCDDEDPEVNPDAEEIWYDGVDQDCSGVYTSDYDQDGDGEDAMGFEDEGVEGTDCDDTDATVFSEADELWDGQDNNCDEVIDTITIFDADYDWFANTSSYDGYFGFTALALEDYDGDGTTEFAVGGPTSGEDGSQQGWLQVFSIADGDGTPADSAHARAFNTSDGAWFGWDAALLDDMDGDGYKDVLVGSPLAYSGSGGLYLMSGGDLAAGGEIAQGNALSTFVGPTYAGFTVSNVGDLNGDGYPEVGTTVTDYLISLGYGIPLEGAIWDAKAHVDSGSGGTSVDVLATFVSSAGRTGGELVTGADYDGDGLGDMLVTVNVSAGGAVVMLPGSDLSGGATLDVGEYDKIAGAEGYYLGGHAARMSDLDGDGLEDFALAAPGYDGTGTDVGAVFVFLGAAELEAGAAKTLAHAYIEGTEDNGQLSLSIDQSADADGDGDDDLVVATTAMFASGVTPTAWLVPGSSFVDGGSVVVTDVAPASFESRTQDDWFGHAGILFDADGDDDADLLLGGPNNNAVGMAALYLNRLDEVE